MVGMLSKLIESGQLLKEDNCLKIVRLIQKIASKDQLSIAFSLH